MIFSSERMVQLNKETSKKLKLKTIQTTSPKEMRTQQFCWYTKYNNVNLLISIKRVSTMEFHGRICNLDYLQTYDNHQDDVGAIDIQIINDLTVTAPKEFDLRELYLLGSQKTNDPSTAGQYGEGSVVTVSLIKLGRDYVTSVSGNMVRVISIASLLILIYDRYSITFEDQKAAAFY